VVIDTKVLVSGLGWPGLPARMLDGASNDWFELVTSPALLAELRAVLAYPKIAKVIDGAAQLTDLVASISVVVTPSCVLTVASNESTNRALEAAVEGEADCIMSDDASLLDLRWFEGIEILRSA
jgi:putative PIN family toxin of toxin-antitoxin system